MPKADTKETFIKKAKAIWGDTYDYSSIKYVNNQTPIKLNCSIHGDFEVRPIKHLHRKQGCKKCGIAKRNDWHSSNTEEFISKAKKIHGDKYSYDKTEYKNAKDKVIITCPIHGDFEQRPNDHLGKRGCSKCKFEKIGYSKSLWKKAAKESKHFIAFILYVLIVENEEERFIKIGRTFTSLSIRYGKSKGGRMPYNYEEILVIEGGADEIFDLENVLKRKFKDHSYIPKIDFKGKTECFDECILDEILKKLKNKKYGRKFRYKRRISWRRNH